MSGLGVFLGKGNCASCHSGPLFTDNQFHNLGLPQVGPNVPATDLGRFTDGPALFASPFNRDGLFSDDRTTGLLADISATPPEGRRGAFPRAVAARRGRQRVRTCTPARIATLKRGGRLLQSLI